MSEKTNVWQRTYTDGKGNWFHVFTNKKTALIVEESAKFGVFVIHCSIKYAKTYIAERTCYGFAPEGKAFELSFNQYEMSPYAEELDYWPVEYR